MSSIYNIEKNHVSHNDLTSNANLVNLSTSTKVSNNGVHVEYKTYQNIFFYFSLVEIIITSLLTLASPFVILSLFFAMGMEGLSGLAFNFHTLFFVIFMIALILYPFSCIGSIYIFYKHSKNKDKFGYKQLIESSVAIIYGLCILAFYYFLFI